MAIIKQCFGHNIIPQYGKTSDVKDALIGVGGPKCQLIPMSNCHGEVESG